MAEQIADQEREALLQPFKDMLETGGFYVEHGTDMHKFAARLFHRERHVYLGLRNRIERQDRSQWIAIHDGADELVCCIAWRIFETDDLLAEISEFLPRYCQYTDQDPPWRPSVSAEIQLKGRIGYRAGLNSFRHNHNLGWFTASLASVFLYAEGCDIQAGECRPDMIETGRARTMSGYWNNLYLGEIDIKPKNVTEALTLVWSDRDQISEEIKRRHRILSQCEPQDFRAFSRTFDTEQ